MVRKTLLATTALVLGASLAFATIHHGTKPDPRHPQRGSHASMLIGKNGNQAIAHHYTPKVDPGKLLSNFSKEPNAQFVSWYGWSVRGYHASYYYSSHYHYKDSSSASNATPITGAGKAPKSFKTAGFSYDPSVYEFQGAILSATSSGLPNKTIATTSAFTMSDTSICCGQTRTVAFTGAPKLTAGAEYFAAVQCQTGSSDCDGGWNIQDSDYSGDSLDYYHDKYHDTYRYTYMTRTSSYGFSSPWHQSSYGPDASGVALIK